VWGFGYVYVPEGTRSDQQATATSEPTGEDG